MAKRQLIGGIDVGTTKICSCIAEAVENQVHILGTGWVDSRGISKGMITNLSEAIRCIRTSVEQAEEEAGEVLDSVYASIGGKFLRCLNRVGTTEVRGRQGQVTGEDVQRAIREAEAGVVPEGAEVLHVLTQGFCLDNQNGIENPLGMSGKILTAKVHLVLHASPVVKNLINAVQQANLAVQGVIMQPLASAEAVLTEDERELGAVVIDIGGGTTDLTVYARNAVWHSQVLPLGGTQVTKDVAFGLHVPLEDAERLKIEQGGVFPDAVPPEEMLEIAEMGSGRVRLYSRRLLCQIMEARCEEILASCRNVLQRTGLQLDLLTGIVLTGGGSLVSGLMEMAQRIFNLPVRLGMPLSVHSEQSYVLGPAHATVLGLIRYPLRLRNEDAWRIVRAEAPRARTDRWKSWLFEKI